MLSPFAGLSPFSRPRFVASGGGTPSVVAHAGTNVGASGGNSCVTNDIDTTGANFIVVNCGWFVNALSGTLTDSKGNTWTPLSITTSSGVRVQLFYCFAPTAGSSHTFTFSASGSFPSIEVIAFDNIASSPFDLESGASGSGSTIQPGSITPSQANAVVIVGLANESAPNTPPSINGGYTMTDSHPYDAILEGSAIAYQIFTAASAQNPTWTLPGSTSAAAAIASFKY